MIRFHSMSFFPATDESRTVHAQKAIICAVQILGNIDNLNEKLKAKGLPRAKIGIGLHSGNATVGNVGGEIRVNYTAIGDTVNVAARLEGLCKEFADFTPSSEDGIIIFSEDVLSRAPLAVQKRHIGEIKVRGRTDKLTVYMIDKEMAEKMSKISLHELYQLSKKSANTNVEGENVGNRRVSDKNEKKKTAS